MYIVTSTHRAHLYAPQDGTNALQESCIFFSIDLHVPIIYKRARWESNGVTVAGGNGRGHQLNQLNGPRGLFVDDDHTIYIADYRNHRIMEWKRNVISGRVVAGGNGLGNRFEQLHFSTDILIDKETKDLLICDYGNQRVMKYTRENCTTRVKVSTVNSHGLAMDINNILYTSDYEKEAVLRDTNEKTNRVAGGNGTANLLNQFSYPTYIFVDLYNSIYISDTHNHRVMKWTTGANQGIVVAGGHGQGNDLKQLSSPRQISVDFFGNIYIADSGNHRIMRWFKNDLQGTVIAGGNNPGNQPNQLKFPWGLSFDQLDNLYVADWGNSRIQRFDIESN